MFVIVESTIASFNQLLSNLKVTEHENQLVLNA